MSVFENRVLRRIFGPTKGEVTKERRKLLTGYCSGDKIENKMGEACSAYAGEEKHIKGFGGET